MNPEFRQTLNTLSHNLETANQTAQENIYTFTQLYVDPCLAGFKSCLHDFTAPCFGNRDDPLRRRRGRGRSRGRAEHFFDFYDDWDDEEDAGHTAIAGWGNDELDSLLAGQGQTNSTYNTNPPQRQRGMSYGSRARRKTHTIQPESDEVPLPIPGSNIFGFLERLPWNIGSRVLKYRPSPANLQENPGGLRMADADSQSPFPSSADLSAKKKGHSRQRSDTANSRSTMNSLSSRGDLILSEEEEDAIALDDEFAVILGRRTTNTATSEDHSSGKTGSSGRHPGPSRRTTRTPSSKSISKLSKRSGSQKSLTSAVSPSVEEVPPPLTQSVQELQQEEIQLGQAEELEIAQKREAAQRLAVERGLSAIELKSDEGTDTPSMAEVRSPRPMSPMPGDDSRRDTEPFPALGDDRPEEEERRDPP